MFHVNPMKIHEPSQVHGETSSGSPWLSLERTGAAAFRRLKGERLGIYHGLIQECHGKIPKTYSWKWFTKKS